MKKVLAIVISILLLLLSTACNEVVTQVNSQQTDTVSHFANEVSSAEILSKFNKADEAYTWFTEFSAIDLAEESVEIDSETFYRVKHNKFSSTDTLRQYLLELFDEASVDQLFSRKTPNGNPQFIDTDYDLYSYTNMFGMYRNELNNISYIVKQLSDTEVVVTAEIQYTSETGTYTCQQEYNVKYINDRWVFTDFKAPYEVVLENIG